jgi:fructokinase
MSAMSRILCVGEALIDVVTRPEGQPSEHVGGSLLNVANGIARLGHRASICSWWGSDPRGALIAEAAASAGTEVEPGTDSAAVTSVAQATLDAEGRATYTFDLSWDLPEVADLDGVAHVHTGSIGATLEPGGAKVVDLVTRLRATATISYDPNARPAIMGTPADVIGRVEALVALSDVVKASDEDLEWLYPGVLVADALRRWVDLGPALAVCTRGPLGAYAVLRNARDHLVVPQNTVRLADTVGAGDSFMAGLISGLSDAGLVGGPAQRERLYDAGWAQLGGALHRAVITSSLTVSHPGAYGPSLAEVRDAVAADPSLA